MIKYRDKIINAIKADEHNIKFFDDNKEIDINIDYDKSYKIQFIPHIVEHVIVKNIVYTITTTECFNLDNISYTEKQ